VQLKAKNELRETEELRKYSINAIREWIAKNPRIIKCRMDSSFILHYLRYRKFSIPMTMEAIERYLIVHEGLFGMKCRFTPFLPVIDNLFETAECFYLPLPEKDKNGNQILFIDIEKFYSNYHKLNDLIFVHGMTIFLLLSLKEEIQVNSFVYVIDPSGLSVKDTTAIPLSLVAKLIKIFEVIKTRF
jgi:hypothetical protein